MGRNGREGEAAVAVGRFASGASKRRVGDVQVST